ncbi:hypothetical protein V6N11_005261 [Hibiscus sabdariffa]|uniref:Uncharacterized protein n=1 Tax=Hibiscus sabdariffa TaxID=183260 RepID=A0ABR2RMS9_9ROSI
MTEPETSNSQSSIKENKFPDQTPPRATTASTKATFDGEIHPNQPFGAFPKGQLGSGRHIPIEQPRAKNKENNKQIEREKGQPDMEEEKKKRRGRTASNKAEATTKSPSLCLQNERENFGFGLGFRELVEN